MGTDDIMGLAKEAAMRLHERTKHDFVDWLQGEDDASTAPAAVMLATLVGAAQMIAVAHLDCGGTATVEGARNAFRRGTAIMEETLAQYVAFLLAANEAETEKANGRKPS